MKITKTHLKDIQNLREMYFKEIVLAQEFFIEWKCKEGEAYLISRNDETAGYLIADRQNVLVEFYLTDKFIKSKEEVFLHTVKELNIKKALCKSFDNILLVCCHTFGKSSAVIGTMFRDYSDDFPVSVDIGIRVRKASMKEFSFLLAQKDGLYETSEELEKLIKADSIFMFEKESFLIGCGFMIETVKEKNYRDIGMWTNPEFRRKGYASMIISFLKRQCLENGLEPVCGCGSANAASRKTLEKNGFVSKYCILEFTF